jgi:hypothetical protein
MPDAGEFAASPAVQGFLAGQRRRETMPILKLSFKEAEGGLLLHGFLAKPAAAEKMQKAHAEICPQYGPAFKEGETIEEEIEIEKIPDFDADSIAEWVEDLFCLDDDDDGDSEEDDDAEDDDEEVDS